MKSFLLTVFSCFFIVNAFSQVNLNQGLIGYFPFNGDANDRSGFNNNPSYNTGTLAPDRFGNPNQAYWFNGINNNMTIPGAAGLNTASAMSVALYFNPENTNLATLVGKIDYTNGNGTQFQVAINWSSQPGVLFGINNPADACGSQIVQNSSYVNTGGSLPVNQWYCLAATYDQGVQKIYLNGTLIQQRTTPFNTLKQCANSDIQIGCWWQDDQQRFKGRIDDVRIYNRALNQAEVTALCTVCSAPITDFYFKQNVCNPLSVQFTGAGGNLLDPHWDFGDGTPQETTPSPVHAYANPGNYTVRFIVQNGNCKDTITKNITVKVDKEDIVLTPDTTICSGTPLQLQAKPALSFCWQPTTYLTNANTLTPTATPLQNTTYYFTAEVPGTNLVRNGSFSNGNVDFTSQYINTARNGGENEYTVTATPTNWNPLLGACTDHTGGNGNMLLINGATQPNVKVWTQTIAVTPNTNYAFSAWLQNANVNGAGSNPPKLQFSINGYNIGNIMQGRQQMCIWDQFYSVWNSGNNTSATISIVNQNTVASGNDYALDDISFSELKILRDSVKVSVEPPPVHTPTKTINICRGASVKIGTGITNVQYTWNTGATTDSIVVSTPGTYWVQTDRLNCSNKDTIIITQIVSPADYTYKQDICNPLAAQFFGVGSVTSPDWDFADGNIATGITNPVNTFPAFGNYTVKMAVESAGCKDTITKTIAIIVTDANIVLTNDTTICLNTSAQLRGQTALSFCWSPTTWLANANTTTPVATPQTNTTYYYTAEVPGVNLVKNGDFSNGNTDFTSSYQYNSSGLNPAVYFVGSNPAAWNPGMPACKDHTTGTGNMLLVNGSQQINVEVWSQTITVTPNTNYAFSAWLQHITTINPARLQFSINNIPIGNIFQANSTSCIWDQFYSVWNSGNITSATISIINMNQSFSGNDFALDDISFAELKILRDSVKVNVTPCTGCDKDWLQLGAQPSQVNLGDLDIAGNQITVEAKINRTTTYDPTFQGGDVVSKHSDPSTVNYLLRPNIGAITTTNGFYQTPGICDLELNKTYHIAMVYDGSTLKFFRDGFLMSQVAATGNLYQNNFPTLIGQYSGTWPEQFVGYVNEVRIWNIARSQADIRANMNTTLASPTTQTGLQAYYVFDNLINKQGNATWNATSSGNATVGAANGNCVLQPDSCKTVKVQFTTPDTVCVNTPVTITNTSSGASSYYWNFCVADINNPPAATNLGNPSSLLTGPVFMDYAYDNGNYYGFVVNFAQARLVRLDYGNSLLNTPTAVNLGNYGGILQTNGSEGIQVVQNEGRWYALIVGGSPLSGTQPRIVKIDFGTNITNPGIATNWGNIGNMNQPVDLHVFKEGNNWYGFTVNAENHTITRFNFTNSFNNTPTGTNLGNIGGLQYPTGIYAINDNGFWRVFITNAGYNQRVGTASSLTRLDFGSSLLNAPTGVNLGNPGGQLRHPRDFTIMKFCGEIVGFAVNGNPGYNDLVRLNFGNNLTTTPTITSLGNTGNLDFPHSLSKLFRVNDDVYAFITNAANNTITRLRFQGCTNASVASSTIEHPQPVTYSSPGTYNINLTIDDGLPTQASYCKQVVVLAPPAHTPTQAVNLCTGDNVKIGTGVKYAKYTWNTGATTDSIIVNTGGTYWVQTDRFGCTNNDTVVVTEMAKPMVNIGPDVTLCKVNNILLDAGNAGSTYLWQDGSTSQTLTVNAFGKYYVRVTNAIGCVSSDTIVLSQQISVPADFSYKQDICNPLTVLFTAAGNNPLNAYWEFGDGNTTTGSLTATNSYTGYSNYTVRFGYESNGCKDTITKIIAINVTQSNLVLTPDTTICFNTTKQLHAQPALSFCWSPTTYLNDPLISNPVTSTTEKITYYYTAEVPGANLARNGDFSNGNVDFTSSYQYSTTGFNPEQYFVGPNPVLWHPQMAACKDHTTGTGNMLLVNGAQQLNANVWSQTITVTPNTNYAFSAWLQNISTVNPARLQFSINNVPFGNIFEANSNSCIWDQFYSSWNSGNQTTATISILNMNQVFSGNDFALDDISFAPVYIQRDSVIISVDTPAVFTRTDTTICKDEQVQLQASGAATYTWTPAAGLSTTTISNPVATPIVSTEYIVTGINANGCAAKDTVNINLYTIPTVIADRTVDVCPDIPVQLSANTTLTSWLWAPATGLTSTTISNPVAAPTVNTEYTVTAKTTDGCTVKDTIDVNLYNLPTVIADRSLNVCPETPVQLLANSTLASWSWTPATGLSSTTISNPIATPNVNTEYRVTGITTDGCTVKDTININLYTLPTVLIDRTIVACFKTPVQLSTNNSLTSWLWTPAAGLTSTTISNPVATPAVSTEYIVTGKTTDGCAVKDTIDIKLHPIPTVITNHDLIACPNTTVQLSANNAMTSWLWTPALYLNNPDIANPTTAPAKSLTYTVQVKDQHNCTHTDTVHVQKIDPRFTLLGANHSICYGASVSLQVTGGDSYLWTPAGSLNNSAIANPVAKPDTSTTYTVHAKENTCGTDSTIQVRVNVNPIPVVEATKENDVNCVVHVTPLHATGTPGTTYQWAPAASLDKPNQPNPVASPDTTTRYYVTALNQYGCTTVDSVTVYVEAAGKVTFMVPNAFTPNNDGHNDCFGVKSWGGATIEEFSVFNRWGQRVFSSKNATACWNGRFNGELQPAGGYVYVITAKTFCGNIKRTGTVMLIR